MTVGPKIKIPPHHMVAEPGAIDWRNEVLVPTEEYYEALRKDLENNHPKASRFVLDHLISLEALLVGHSPCWDFVTWWKCGTCPPAQNGPLGPRLLIGVQWLPNWVPG